VTRAGTFVLLADDSGGWQVLAASDGVAPVDVAGDGPPSRVAGALAGALRAKGYAGGPVILALPAAMCFPAGIGVNDLPRGDRRAMTYRFEESSPCAAESVVADFVVAGGRALGVCVRPGDWKPLLDALAAAGIEIGAVVPAALLAAQGCGDHGGAVLIVPEIGTDHVNVLVFAGDKPTAWASVPASGDDVAAQLRAMSVDASATISSTSDVDVPASRDLGITSIAALNRAAFGIAAGRAEPWVNLRRDALAPADAIAGHRRPLNAFLAVAAVFLLALTLAAFLRANRYAHAQRDAEAQMRAAMLALFPDGSGPVNVAIVESEHRKAVAAGGGAGAPDPRRASALRNLADLLSRLPAADDLSVTRMSFGEASFELEGRVGAYERLDALAAAAREAGFDVAPPQTRKEGESAWTFVARGARRAGAGDGNATVAEGGGR
jgi:hypothetical protein